MDERSEPRRNLDTSLQGILKDTPGEERVSRALAFAHVLAIEQLEALGEGVLKGSAELKSLENRPDAELVAERIIRLAEHLEREG